MNRDLTAATKENLERLVILVPVMIVFLIIGLPLIYYVWRTFWTQAPGAGGHFTLAGFYDLQNPLVYDTLLNTVIYATVGTGIALFVGIWTAFLQRTDMRGRTVLKYIVIGQFLVPSFILAIGWSIVARPAFRDLRCSMHCWPITSSRTTTFANRPPAAVSHAVA